VDAMQPVFVRAAVMVGAMLVSACDEGKSLDAAAIARGKKIASSCGTCHSLTEERNRIGPHLVSVLGRKAGTVPGYDYSAAMKQYAQEWTPERTAAFLEDPLRVVPGTKMGTTPLRPKEASDLVTYLRSLE
jgi:cytochrome c